MAKNPKLAVWGENGTLITSAEKVLVEANNESDVHQAAVDGATAFLIESGDVGRDQLFNFSSNDSILNSKKIFDGNEDGFIQFGPNGVLDIDRTSAKKAGNDQLQVTGINGADIKEIRYLGSKEGYYVYADSATLKNLWTEFGQSRVMESKVTDETFQFKNGTEEASKILLVDNALGLNMGADTLNNFGDDDLLVTTAKLWDKTGNGIVTFGNNYVLDVSGDDGGKPTDPNGGPGGQLDFNAPNAQEVHYLGAKEINGVTYYYYGTANSDFALPPV